MDPNGYENLSYSEKIYVEKKLVELDRKNNVTNRVLNSSQATQPEKNKTISLFDQLKFDCGLQNLTKTSSQNQKTLSIKDEIKLYNSFIKKDTNFENFWLNFHSEIPKLANLTKKYNAISASSVPSESAFSVANYIQRKQRSNLSPNSLKYSMVLKSCMTNLFLTN